MARGSASGYQDKRTHPVYGTANWKALRKRKLGRNPLCQICERRGRSVVATTVDHVKALSKGGPAFPDPDTGLVSLCTRCPQLKTARSDHGRVTLHHTRNMFAGTDTSGNPLDPDDPWNATPLGEGGSDH